MSRIYDNNNNIIQKHTILFYLCKRVFYDILIKKTHSIHMEFFVFRLHLNNIIFCVYKVTIEFF